MAEPTDSLINDVPLLARLSTDDRKALAAAGRLRTYAQGDVIVRQGDPGDAMHVIIEGEVRIFIANAEGNEVTIATMGPGDIIGELSLLDGRPRAATMVTNAPTRTFSVSRKAFTEWLESRPAAALALLATLAGRVRRDNESLSDRFFLDAGQRLAKLLATQANGTPSFRIRTTQAQMAAELGITRESVNKQLNQFERAGLVMIRRGSVTVLDPAALMTIVG